VALLLAWFLELTPTGVEIDREAPGAPRPAVTGVRRYADIVIIGVLVVIVAVLLARQGGLIEDGPDEQVVAVLPFANMSAEAEDGYFGEGLADTMIQRLGQLSELVVLASQSTFQFTGRDLDLKMVGAKLGATAIMTGSVQRAGNALRINARLVEAGSGKQLWSGSYDRTPQDVFAIQDEIAMAAVEALHLVLAPEAEQRLHTPATSNLTAYDAYVLGVSRLAARTDQDRQQALDYFRQAITSDPGYALAYTGLVEGLYLQAHTFTRSESLNDILGEARAAAGKALELDPKLGEAWLARALASVVGRDFLGSRELSDADIISLFEKAIELSPNNAMAHKYFANFYSNSLGTSNDREITLMQAAARLDPRSGIILVNIAQQLQRQGDLEQAERWLRKSIRTREPYFQAGLHGMIGFHLLYTARLDEAARGVRAWRNAGPNDPWVDIFWLDALAGLGAWSQAESELQTLPETPAPRGHMDPVRFTRLSMGSQLARRSGDLESAAQLAEQSMMDFHETRPESLRVQDRGFISSAMISLALHDIARGRAEQAIARFEAAYPGPFEEIDTTWNEPLRPVVMLAALYKQAGDKARGEALLRDYLAFVRDPANEGLFPVQDWTEFTILAMLGRTEEALDEFERRVDAGYLYLWWQLKDGAFDPDYAAVVDDPRFEALYARITTRVDELRASFLAEPDLPGEDFP
jgi:TolB-like protein